MSTAKEIIMAGTQPSTGCTEPVAVAWACSLARQAVGGYPLGIKVFVDGNVYKNAISVGIPFSEGKYGLEYAAALGCLGNPSSFLRVLETVPEEDRGRLLSLLGENKVEVHLDESARELKIEAEVKTDKGVGYALIEKSHTRLTQLKANGHPIEFPFYCEDQNRPTRHVPKIGEMSIKELLGLTETIDEELSDWIWQGIEMDMAIARKGLEEDYGLAVGRKLQRLVQKGKLGDDAASYASYLTAAAVDARMGGANFPVMTNAGSGNQGLGAILPIMAFVGFNGIKDRNLITRAIAAAHIISIYVKEHTGVLSYFCGCAHGATAGAAAGILILCGYDVDTVSKALQNITADLTGIICDGGKPGCALKLALSAGEAVRIAMLAAEGLEASPSDGIVGMTAEDSIAHIGKISKSGAATADQTIIQILDQYHQKKQAPRQK